MRADTKLSIKDYISNKSTRAVAALFVMNAFLFSHWAVRIPDIKDLLQLTDGTLGLALLTSPLGVVVITPIVSVSIRRFGPGVVAIMGAILYALTIISIGYINSYSALLVTLFILGVANGAMDIAMNAAVSALEKMKQSIFMSTTHGFWSLSAMVFTLIASYLVGLQITHTQHLLWSGVSSLLFLVLTKDILFLKDKSEAETKFQMPGRSVFVLVTIAFIVFLTEGGIMDWNAVFFKEVLQSPEYFIGYGFAAFSFAMAVARFYGDNLIEKHSTRKLILGGCLILAVGLLFYAMAFSIVANLLSMALAGLGCSILIPVLFREAGLLKDVPPSVGIATVSTLGYTGFLVGPPLIGFLSEAFSLQTSFFLLAILIAGAGMLSLRLKV